MGVSPSLKASNQTGHRLVVSLSDAEPLIERFGTSNKDTRRQLKQEFSQSVASLTHSVKQIAAVIVDVALIAVSYVLLSIAQVFASFVLDR